MANQPQAAEAVPRGAPIGLEALVRLDLLPAFKSSIAVGSVSSYDRTGGNDDGFSGKYSFVRQEPDGLVLADLAGPGVIYRVWTPTPSDDVLEFYFDGETRPRLGVPFRQMFLGKHEPFVEPLVGHGVGGFYSYVPLPYAKSCKVLARAKRVQFYQINYATYPPGTPVATYRAEPTPASTRQIEQAKRLFAAAGSDLSAWVVPPGARAEVARQSVQLKPGAEALVFEKKGPGRIAGLRLSPVSALAGKGRDLLLRINFDGAAPAVLCPAGDFFGFAWGQPAMQSLLVGARGDVAYCYFPMPFERSARIDLVSDRRTGPAVELQAEVVHAAVGRGPQEGRFYAVWRRENPTVVGQPFTFLETQGRGHMVGCVLQSQGFESGKTLFFEGDDQTWIDGQLAIHGTGSEDFFNGGWYDVPDRWDKPLNLPLSGCLGYQKHLGRTGAYRLFLADAYTFHRDFRQLIEHGGEKNSIPTDYAAVTYLYLEDRPSGGVTVPPLAQRAVVDLPEVIFPAWWQIPIRAFCFQRATLSRSVLKLRGEEVRFLSFKAEGADWFGEPFLQVGCEMPAAGRYGVYLETVKGPGQGRVQLFENEMAVGEPVDLYASAQEKSGRVKLGDLQLVEGTNYLMLKLVGKHEQSAGLGLDLIAVVCRKP